MNSGIPTGCGSSRANGPGVETPGYCQASSGREHRRIASQAGLLWQCATPGRREAQRREHPRRNVRRTFESSPTFQRRTRCRETQPRPGRGRLNPVAAFASTERAQARGEAALHASPSGEGLTGASTRTIAVEQLPQLRLQRGRHGLFLRGAWRHS